VESAPPHEALEFLSDPKKIVALGTSTNLKDASAEVRAQYTENVLKGAEELEILLTDDGSRVQITLNPGTDGGTVYEFERKDVDGKAVLLIKYFKVNRKGKIQYEKFFDWQFSERVWYPSEIRVTDHKHDDWSLVRISDIKLNNAVDLRKMDVVKLPFKELDRLLDETRKKLFVYHNGRLVDINDYLRRDGNTKFLYWLLSIGLFVSLLVVLRYGRRS